MKPIIFEKVIMAKLDPATGKAYPSIDGAIPMYSGNSGTIIECTEINASKVKSLENNATGLINHLSATNLHVTSEEKAKIASDSQALSTHIGTGDIHVSIADRVRWDAKETPANAQAKADAVQANLDTHINDYDLHLTTEQKTLLSGGIYNKVEIDNKLAQLTNGLDWKEAVQKYSDLEIVYPNAQDGWTANVIEDSVTYRYTIPKNILDLEASGYNERVLDEKGEEFAKRYTIVWIQSKGYYKKWNGTQWVVTANIGSWIAISANAITKATDEKDGLMSKEDYSKLLTVEEKANYYIHPNSIDINAVDKHLSDAQRTEYAQLDTCVRDGNPLITVDPEGVTTYTYKGILTPAEREKLKLIEDEANYYVHPESHSAEMITETTERRFITTDQLNSLDNMATKTLASLHVDGLMSKEDYAKLADIDFKANNYIHPTSHPATMIETDENHRFVSDTDKEKWNNPSVVTTTANGLMIAEDKVKLDSVDLTEIAKIPTLEYNVNTLTNKIKNGVSTFMSGGTTIIHNFGNKNYSVSITLVSDDETNPNDNVSKIWVRRDDNSCTVFANIVDATKSTQFSYTLIKFA